MSNENGKPLADRVAIVTGGSRGIGAAIAERLASGGATVVLTYKSASDQAAAVLGKIEAAGGSAVAKQLDVGDLEAGRQVVAAVAKELGKIDVLVNSAGVLDAGEVADVTVAQFDNTMNVNVRGIYVLTQAALAHMPNGGRVIHIGSIFGESVPFPGIGLYSISKFAVAGMTRAMARDLGPKGITVNCIQPGPIDTEMNPADGDLAQLMTPRSPIGRYGRPEEIAELVAYLAGPNTDNTTGGIFNVDGAWNA